MKFNDILKKENRVLNCEGAAAFKMSPEMELYTAAVTSALSGKFYESSKEFVERISSLVSQVDPRVRSAAGRLHPYPDESP